MGQRMIDPRTLIDLIREADSLEQLRADIARPDRDWETS